jgi:hypothetical protein
VIRPQIASVPDLTSANHLSSVVHDGNRAYAELTVRFRPIADIRLACEPSSMAYSDRRSRLLGCVLLPVLGVAILALPLAWLAGDPYTSTFPRAFDADAWKAADPSAYPSDDTRCGMIADLRYRVGVEGKSRGELSELLGEPLSLPRDRSASYWLLCPSFLDVWVLKVRWQRGHAIQADVHDT